MAWTWSFGGLGKLIGNLIKPTPKPIVNQPKSNTMAIKEKDPITLQRIEMIHPALRQELRQIYDEICASFPGKTGVRFVQVFRTFAEQDALYAQGRTKPGPKVTDAPGGKSYHNYGLGVDFCLLDDKNQDGVISSDEIIWNRNTDLDKDQMNDWMEVVKIFLKYDWVWGASWKDYPHFEKSFGYSVSKLLVKYKAGEFIPGTKYVKL